MNFTYYTIRGVWASVCVSRKTMRIPYTVIENCTCDGDWLKTGSTAKTRIQRRVLCAMDIYNVARLRFVIFQWNRFNFI